MTTANRTVRQANEARVYDARAGEIGSALADSDLLVDVDHPPYPNREHVEFLDFLFEQVGDPAGKRILEVGCGSGNLTTYLALRGARCVGVDVSEGMLGIGRRRAAVNGVEDRVEFVAQPVEDLDHPDGSYDIVIANQVLHHLDLGRAMPTVSRLVGTEGVALFVEPVLFVPEWLRSARYSTVVTRFFPSRADTPDERSVNVSDLETIRGAFSSSHMTPYQLTARLQNFVELSDDVFRRLERFDRTLLDGVPGSWRLARYVVLVLSNRPSTRPEGTPS